MGEDGMPKTGHAQSILMWDSFIWNSFVEVALLSVTGLVAAGPVVYKE